MPFLRPDLFLNPGLLAGLALIAIPVVLHFLLKSKPKRLAFPALRLLRARQTKTVRRLRLKHIGLLLLRIGAIALLVFALARPSLPAANYGLTFGESAVLIGVLIVAAGAYFGVAAYWQRQHLPRQTFAYRRTLLRAGVICAMALLLLLLVAWPYGRRISAEMAAPVADRADDLPVAAVFLFDTSPSMGYVYEGESRLEASQAAAARYVGQLPRGSRTAVGGTAAEGDWLFRQDPAVARRDIERLNVTASSRTLDARILDAIRAQQSDRQQVLRATPTDGETEAADRYLREIYVFTDLAASAWQLDTERLRAELERLPFVHVYLIDVGVDRPRNAAVREIRLSRQSVPAGTPLLVDVTLSTDGDADVQRTIELRTATATGQEQTRSKRVVTLSPGQPTVETFSLTGLDGPFVQGRVVLSPADAAMTFDDERYFTARVEPPPNVLMLSGRAGEADYLREALAPSRFAELGKAPFRIDEERAGWLDSQENRDALDRYDVVCLVDVPELPPAAWSALNDYVRGGGGLAVFLGSERIKAANWISAEPKEFLPGELLAVRTFTETESLSLVRKDHPLLERLFDLNGATDLSRRAVDRCWRVVPADDATVVAWYTTNSPDTAPTPALLERAHGAGRVVMLTTSVWPGAWSDLAKPSWPFLVLTHEMMHYLNGRRDDRFNYAPGEEASLTPDEGRDVTDYLLRRPSGVQTSERAAGTRLLVIPQTDEVGNYTILGAATDSGFTAGFSVNGPAEESDFTKLTKEELDALFGPERYRLGTTLDDLERFIVEGRIGQELFPHVLFIAILLFCAEHLIANRFYEAEQSPTAEPQVSRA